MLLSRPGSLAESEELSGTYEEYTIVIVTHSMQQAARISDRTAFCSWGNSLSTAKPQNCFSLRLISGRRTTSQENSAKIWIREENIQTEDMKRSYGLRGEFSKWRGGSRSGGTIRSSLCGSRWRGGENHRTGPPDQSGRVDIDALCTIFSRRNPMSSDGF